MEKYMNKYRIDSHRMKGWDYGKNALYFITICTKNRRRFFRNVTAGRMKLSPIGHIANSCFHEIPNHFASVLVHNHIVMPNHMHGIIEIAKSDSEGDYSRAQPATVQTPNLGVSSATTSTPNTSRTAAASKKWKPTTLGSILNQYKRACTINSRPLDSEFAWQPNYHDIIIWNHQAYINIFNYITNNPLKWGDDTFHSNI